MNSKDSLSPQKDLETENARLKDKVQDLEQKLASSMRGDKNAVSQVNELRYLFESKLKDLQS